MSPAAAIVQPATPDSPETQSETPLAQHRESKRAKPISESTSSSPDQSLAASILARYHAVRADTLALVRPLSPEDLMVQSCPEASPAKWHLAHTSWFFETFVLSQYLPGYQPFHPNFGWLFNSYYNSLGEMPEKKLRASFSRPPLSAILDYRTHVDQSIEQLLSRTRQSDPAILTLIRLGLEHEQQHQELIATDIKHALFTNPLHPAYLEAPDSQPNLQPPSAPSTQKTTSQQWAAFPGGLTRIGTNPAPSASAFAFDNETPEHTVYLVPYELATRLVTCAEYLAFIEDGGYQRPELWLSEGWAMMREQGWQAPLYWLRSPTPSPTPSAAANTAAKVAAATTSTSGTTNTIADTSTSAATLWTICTLHGLIPFDQLSHTPVCHLSLFEADAFARWSGCRLPTEFEWEHAARLSDPTSHETNATEQTLTSLHPTPATAQHGLQQMVGELWQWTSSGYTGYPGYQPLPGALGEYNGKFMSSQVILRGGSCVTPPSHIRLTYRNFFPPGTRWQFSGLRLAR